jgi:hypothetical protein
VYGRENWSLTLREEHTQIDGVSEQGAVDLGGRKYQWDGKYCIMRIFAIYTPRRILTRRILWARYVSLLFMGKMRNA